MVRHHKKTGCIQYTGSDTSDRHNRLDVERRSIVVQIRDLYSRDAPLNITAVKRQHPALMAKVFKLRPFWGWKQALDAAGIDYGGIRVSLLDYVTCGICGKPFANLVPHLLASHQVPTDEYRIDYPDAELRCEMLRARIMERHARRRAARQLPHWEPVWSREYVLDRAWAYGDSGYPLNMYAMKQTERQLVRTAQRYFRSWDEVLLCLCLDPQEIRRHQRNPYRSVADIVRAIRTRCDNGLALYHHALARNRPVGDRLLVVTAKRFFGSWREALEAAGVAYSAIARNRKYPTAQTVLREIARRHRLGLGLSYTDLEKEDKPLYDGGHRYFGSWRAAIVEAGLDYDQTRRRRKALSPPGKYPDKTTTVRAILARKTARVSLKRAEVMSGQDRDRELVHAVRRHFGGWYKALDAAGVPHERVVRNPPQPKYPSREAVLDALRRRHRDGIPVNASALENGAHADRPLYHEGLALYGRDWDRVLRAAGLDPRKIRAALYRSIRRYPSDGHVVEEIKRRVRHSIPVYSSALQRGRRRDAALLRAGAEYFGTWSTALSVAGLHPSTARRESILRHTKYPDADSVLVELKRRAMSGEPLNFCAVARPGGHHSDRALTKGAVRFFRSWRNALSTAGLDADRMVLRRRGRYPDKRSVRREIRRRAKTSSPLTAMALSKGPHRDSLLYDYGRKFYGSWADALRAAGEPPERKR